MRLVKAAEMRELDQEATRRYGIPSIILMENAGLNVVAAVLSRFWGEGPRGRTALVLAGPGNNGGDGLVAGRHLFNRGARVNILLTAPPESYQGDAAANLKIVTEMGIPCQVFTGEKIADLKEALVQSDLVIDALFGTGFRGTPQEPVATAIRMVNESGKPVLSIDLPSGLEADTGRVAGECIRARLTVTLGLPKLGLYLEPGASYAGEIVIGDISFPPELRNEDEGNFFLIDQAMVASILPLRLPHHHKGDYGHVVVIGGSRGYTGALALAGSAALRGGAGLVTAVAPASLYPVLAAKLTEVMTRPAPEASEGGGFARSALVALEDLLGRATVLAVGPGLGQDPETGVFLQKLLKKIRLPVVLDADALNLLAREREFLEDPVLREQRKRWVLTPHPGEMARLLNLSVSAVQADRVGNAVWASQKWGAIVVLKGARTVIATPEGKVFINPTGNPGLATGGTGDVLTGLLAALIAQGMSPVQAACAGVYIHGLAADRLAAQRGMAGMAAGDLLNEIPYVLKDLYESAKRRE